MRYSNLRTFYLSLESTYELTLIILREYAGTKKMRFKPVIISHHMLMGLKEGQEKMSKSDPDSAIFMEDAAEDVKRKVSRPVDSHHT